MAAMVWCNSCKKVVWAYDHEPPADLKGICNHFQLPCPKCGKEGNFDGWASNKPYEELSSRKEVYDGWSAMKYVAECEGVEWAPSGDNRWFPEDFHIGFLIQSQLREGR